MHYLPSTNFYFYEDINFNSLTCYNISNSYNAETEAQSYTLLDLKIYLPEEEWFQYRPKVDKTHHIRHFSTGPILPLRDQSLWL